MSVWENVLAMYAMAGVLVFVICGMVLGQTAAWDDRRMLARVMWLSPVWPAVMVWALGRGARKLWKTADWRS